jgi:N-methylhydantoinase B
VDGRIAPSQRVCDIVMGALAQAVPMQVGAAGNGCCTGAIFTGTRPNGAIWVYLETIGGGGGARPDKDGLSGIHVHLTNTSNLPVEALELEYPVTLMRYELIDGSAGLGKFRGGQGLRRIYRVEAACRMSIHGSRVHSTPWGLAGGGAAAGTRFDTGDGRTRFGGMIDLLPGQIVTIETPGGGGHGPVAGRPRAMLDRDLAEARIDAATHAQLIEVPQSA